MKTIERIDRRPGLITFGKDGGDTAVFSVDRGAGTITAAGLLDRSCAPAAPPTVASAGEPEETGLRGWTTGFVKSASDATRVPAVLTGAVS